MPKRSNDFQKLILYLNKLQLPDIDIYESKELIDKITGEKREVDIYLVSSIGNYPIKISVECSERTRKADVTWVEGLKAKHDKLDTDKLILVSKSGFTKQAMDIAKFYRINLLRFDQIDENLTNVLFISDLLYFKTFNLTVDKVTFLVVNSQGVNTNVVMAPDSSIFDKTGNSIGQASDIVSFMTNEKQLADFIYINGQEEHKFFTIEWRGFGKFQINLQEISTKELVQINLVRVTGQPNLQVRPFKTQRGKIGEINFVWGNVIIDNNNFYILGTAQMEKEQIQIFKE